MAKNATSKCPACGTESTGKFCSSCGAPLAGATCAKCGTALSSRSRFCPDCGAPAGGGAAPSQRAAWIVAGVSLLALVVVVVVVVSRRGAPTADGAAAAGASGEQATTDITQMPPEEQAGRLFDRVMRAHEAGDTAQVRFFGPMAIQTYATLPGPLDPDSRLHVGLLHLAINDHAGAKAQADTLLRGSRTHLYGLLLQARAAEARGDAAGMRRALQAFAATYEAERSKNLPEYAQHEQLLLETMELARRPTGAAPTR